MMQGGDDWSLMLGATVPIAPCRTARFLRELIAQARNIRMAQGERENMINVIALGSQ